MTASSLGVSWRRTVIDLASTLRAPGGMAGQCSTRPAAVGTGAARGLGAVSRSSRARSVAASAGGSRRARARDARATPPVKQVIGSRLLTRFEMLDASEEETTDASARARHLARRVVRDAVGVLGRKKVARRHPPEKSAHADAPGNVRVVRVSARPRAQSASTRRHRVASLARGESRECSEADARRDENENARLGLVSRAFAAAASSVVSVVALGATADPALAGFGAPTGVVSSPPCLRSSSRRSSPWTAARRFGKPA